MISLAIVDSGALIAAANRADPDHQRCVSVLRKPTLRLVIPALCVAEVTYLLGKEQGPRVEAKFLRGLQEFDVRSPAPEEWSRIAALVEQYKDLRLWGTDASVISLAEHLGTDLIVTLDHRHFNVVKRADGRPFRLLPE